MTGPSRASAPSRHLFSIVSVSCASATTSVSSRKPAVPLMVWKTRKRLFTVSAFTPSRSTFIRIWSARVSPSPLSERNSPKRLTVSSSRATRSSAGRKALAAGLGTGAGAAATGTGAAARALAAAGGVAAGAGGEACSAPFASTAASSSALGGGRRIRP